MCISAALGLGSAVIGAGSARSAARAQEAAAQQQIDLQRDIYEQQSDLFRPAYDEGRDYAQVRNYLDGIGARPTFGGEAPQIETITIPGTGAQSATSDVGLTRGGGTGNWLAAMNQGAGTPASTQYRVGDNTFGTLDEAQAWANANRTGGTPYQGMQETDAYRFRVNQAQDALEASAAARGGLYSGRTMEALQAQRMGLAGQFEDNYYNRIAGGAAAGQAAAGQQAQAGQNYATGASNALANIGNAQAAGAIGVGNALQGGINNGIGLYQYQQNMNTGGSGGTQSANLFSAPWASGGFWE